MSSQICKFGLLAGTALSLALSANAQLVQQSDQEKVQAKEECLKANSVADKPSFCFGYEDTYLNTILVYGDRTYQQPGSNSVIGAETVDEAAADHPAEILNTLPGVNVQINSGQEHLIALRSPVLTGGAGQGSFLILENGVPTRSPAFGNVNMLFEVHHEVADAIEVVRGPASAKYGSNAVHGLMNFILPGSGPVTDSRELQVTASTLERYKADGVFGSEAIGDGTVVAVSLQHDAGWRDDTSVDQQKLSLSQDFSLAGWDGQAWFSFVNLNQETGGYVGGTDSYKDEDLSEQNDNPEAYRDAKFAMGAVRLDRDFGDVKLNITPYVRWQEMEFRQHFLPYKGIETNSHEALGVQARLDGSWGEAQWRLGGMLDAASGDLKEVQPDPFGFFPGDSRFPQGTHYDYTVDTFAAALWGELEFEIAPDVRVLAGLRGETHDYDYTTRTPAGVFGRFNVPADRSDDFQLFTPKLGLIWNDAFGTVDLYANLARGQRAPQASDLYRLQNLQTVGEIKSETLDSFEIGMRGAAFAERLVFDLAAYTMEKDNYFFRDSSGLNVIDGKTDHKGVEFLASYSITDALELSGTLSWADHTYAFDRAANGIVSGNQIDTAPEWLGDLKLAWEITEKLAASLSAEYVGEYFSDEANMATYPGHTIFSARGSYDVTDDLEAFVIIRNLFDERYADRADFAFGNDRYFPGEPLNATFGIRASW